MIIEKKQLRNKIRELLDLQQNNKTERLIQEVNINNIFLASDLYKDAQNILAYAATDHELSVDLIIKTALKDGKQVALPKTNPETNDMDFYFLDNDKLLEKQINIGNYNIREPVDTLPMVPVQPFPIKTVVIVPGIAFSLSGDRLGHGKGFYDKYFSKIFDLNSTIHLPDALIGVAFNFQIQDKIPVSEYDIALTHIITDNELHICNN